MSYWQLLSSPCEGGRKNDWREKTLNTQPTPGGLIGTMRYQSKGEEKLEHGEIPPKKRENTGARSLTSHRTKRRKTADQERRQRKK